MDATTQSRTLEIETSEWAERCDYWQRKLEFRPEKRKRREKESRPLILAGHGISISVDKGTLLIKDGNTHFPDPNSSYRYYKGALNLPPRIVLVDGSGAITLDALDWLTEQKVDLIRLRWDGRVISAIGASGYAADRRKIEWQLATRATQRKRLEFGIPLISEKLQATHFNIDRLLPPSESRDKALIAAEKAMNSLKSNPPSSISKLLAVEGTVAQGYFFAWRGLELKWRAIGRYPIPEDWKRFFSRSSLTTQLRIKNFRATHPVNAMLNYAYGILEGQLRIDAIAKGYDPTIGLLHDSMKTDRNAFVYDIMEPKRPIVDRAILKMIAEETFSGADFVLQRDGVCRLNPELARLIVQGMGK